MSGLTDNGLKTMKIIKDKSNIKNMKLPFIQQIEVETDEK